MRINKQIYLDDQLFIEGSKEKEFFKVMFKLQFSDINFHPQIGIKPKPTFCDICLEKDLFFDFSPQNKWICLDYACNKGSSSYELCDLHFNTSAKGA